jgi:hypothetical protein
VKNLKVTLMLPDRPANEFGFNQAGYSLGQSFLFLDGRPIMVPPSPGYAEKKAELSLSLPIPVERWEEVGLGVFILPELAVADWLPLPVWQREAQQGILCNSLCQVLCWMHGD